MYEREMRPAGPASEALAGSVCKTAPRLQELDAAGLPASGAVVGRGELQVGWALLLKKAITTSLLHFSPEQHTQTPLDTVCKHKPKVHEPAHPTGSSYAWLPYYSQPWRKKTREI